LSLGQAENIAELNRAETEAREFILTGLKETAEHGRHVQHACEQACEAYLSMYWQQLRDHALSHYVAPRDVDEVLAELTSHYVVAEVQERQASLEAEPFAMAR